MKIMRCPLNGDRNISEFACLGAVKEMPQPEATDDDAWADHIWLADNPAGLIREWWCHTPTNYFFIAERNTVTDEIVRTYPPNEVFRERRDFGPRPNDP